MTRRLLLTYLSITAFALVIVVVPLGITFASRERDRLYFDVERDAQAVAAQSEEDLEAGARPNLTSIFSSYTGDARILVVDDAGRSVADSGAQDLGRDYSTRPEIAEALAGGRASGRRGSETLDSTIVFVAIPVASAGKVHGAVRITLPSSEVDRRVRETWLRLFGLSAVVLGVVGVVGLVLARGVTRPVRVIEASVARLADGQLDARVGPVEGPEELQHLARQFDHTAERLEHLVEAQRRFVADASHQLRTPLTALRLRIETLEPSGSDAPRVAAALAETDRLAQLVEALLVIARSDGASPTTANVELVGVVRERVESWSPVAAAQGVELVLAAPSRQIVQTVSGAPEQIIDNLLANAIEVAPDGTSVEVSIVAVPGGGADLSVTDAGPGLAADERSRALGRFWRAAGATGDGSGLGLAIVDQLVRAGGGSVELLAAQPAPSAGHGLRAVVHFTAPPS